MPGGGTGLFRLRYKKQRQDADQERDSDQEKAVGIGHDISLAAHDGLQLSQGLLVGGIRSGALHREVPAHRAGPFCDLQAVLRQTLADD